MKEQKGITLVALIITIIVMLILVGVTVSVVINSNLIGEANTAKESWQGADNVLTEDPANTIQVNGKPITQW